jgi:hypothetical protein
MPSERGKYDAGLTGEMRKRIPRLALERMEHECETDFELLSGFRADGVNRFLAWIRRIEKPQQKEAALSITCRKLRLRHIECESIPNLERWTESYRDFPLSAGFDLEWRPKRHVKTIASLVKKHLAPVRVVGPQSVDLADDNPLAVPQIRGGLELSTKLADIVLLQFVRGDLGLLDLSYVSLLGLGQTGWRIYEERECAEIVAKLPGFIARAKELVLA